MRWTITTRTLWIIYAVVVAGVALATVGVAALLANIAERKAEAVQRAFQIVEIDERTIDPAVWGRNFPRQYDSYKRTVDTQRTRHGGSEAFQKLDERPVWRTIFAGYSFSVDYREERGHAYMLRDQELTRRVTEFDQPGACLHCHSSILPAYRKVGRGAAPDADPRGQLMKGFEIVCGMPYPEARALVEHPVACIDCHDPASMDLRVTRPGFLVGIVELARSDADLDQYPSIVRWRQGDRKDDYDVNAEASRQEMRTFVCAQCHVEYYFKGDSTVLTYPWSKGNRVENIEAYYDAIQFKDWVHAKTKAPVLKAQHPEFELWSQGIHSRSGVACADCHMPYKREGAVKISDHHVRSPLLNINNACQTCHVEPEADMLARAERIQATTDSLMRRAEQAVADLIGDIERAMAGSIDDERLDAARRQQRTAQWRLDFVFAENSMGFHAPQEAARILGEAIDEARQGQLLLAGTETATAPAD